MKNLSPTGQIVPFQPTLSPALPVVLGNVDYRDFEAQLRRIDQLLLTSGVEKSFVEQSLARYDQRFPAAKTKARQRHQQHSYRALRCNLLRGLLGEDYRGMSRRLAECPLFRWFCGMEELAAVRVPGKSTLQDYAHWLPAETMRPIIAQLILAAHQLNEQRADRRLRSGIVAPGGRGQEPGRPATIAIRGREARFHHVTKARVAANSSCERVAVISFKIRIASQSSEKVL